MPVRLVGSARYAGGMARGADDPAVVVTNPDEDCSSASFRAFIDELLAGPDPEIESVDAAEALRLLRVDAEA